MIHKKQIADIVKKLTKQERGIRDTKIMHPEREWAIGVSIGLLIFLLSALWSVYIYTSNRDISDSYNLESSVEQSLYRETQVDEALKKILERESIFNNATSTISISKEEIIGSATIEEVDVIEVEELPATAPVETIPTTTDEFNIILN